MTDGLRYRPAITHVGIELPVTQEMTGNYLRDLCVSQLSNRAEYL
jgi:hypothetical protein